MLSHGVYVYKKGDGEGGSMRRLGPSEQQGGGGAVDVRWTGEGGREGGRGRGWRQVISRMRIHTGSRQKSTRKLQPTRLL